MKINTALLYWRDVPGGVLFRSDGREHDYMCTEPLLAAQVLQSGKAIVVARDDAAETVGELALRGVEVSAVEVAA